MQATELGRPQPIRRDTEATEYDWDGSESLFDSASTLYGHGREISTFFVQVKTTHPFGKRNFYKNWELCYVHFVREGNEVMLQLDPTDAKHTRNDPGIPKVLLWLKGDSLRTAKSKMYSFMKVGHCTLSAYSRAAGQGPPPNGVETVEQWSFASFGLSTGMDQQAKGFARTVAEAKSWRTYDQKGREVQL
ncbi:hypothetical protein MNV49_002977 [Pseudohyphozyma bogoriensis]|nr:hypothetical protein MNV49_002977 [Pseudohyphozyma bogoriensis]